jgi:hypothetical protein
MKENNAIERFSWHDEGVGMTHLRPARMRFGSCNMFFLMLIAIATLVVGCNQNKPERATTSA